MTIERSKGKARPTLPRSRELKTVPAVPKRSDARDIQGRFAKGNAGGKGRGWKHALAKMLGRDVGDLGDVATSVAEDAWRLFSVSIREMPSDGPNVRALVARKARHEALEGYWTARALAKLGTPEGDAAEQKATLHGQRAERLTVTALDVATRLAQARPPAQGGDLWQALGLKPPPEGSNATTDVDQDDDAVTDSSQDEPEEEETRVSSTPPTRPEETRVSSPPAPVTPASLAMPVVTHALHRSPLTIAPPTATGMQRPHLPTPPAPLCPHGASPKVCVACYHAKQGDAQPGAPWRSLLPGARK